MVHLNENEIIEEKIETQEKNFEKILKEGKDMISSNNSSDNISEKDKRIKIIVDSREKKSLVVDFLSEKCEIEEKVLSVGDYLISSSTCCERKTTNDFVKSIIDGRLFAQLNDLKNTYSKAILIIEGNSLYEEENVRPEAIRGALAAIATDIRIPMIWSKSPRDTAELLIAIAKREQTSKKKEIKIRFDKKPEDMKRLQEYLVAGLPGVDRERAKRLLNHFKCPEFVFTASERELMKVKGIGKKLAHRIRKILSERYDKDENKKSRSLEEFN